MSLVTVICLSVLKYSQQRLVLYWNGEVIRSIKGTHDHIASTPREDAVSCSRVPEATIASRGSRRNLGGQSPLWVKSAVLGVARSLPVYPDQRTSSDRSGWSGSCQNRNWPVSSAGFSFLRNLGWLVAPVCLEASGATKPTISVSGLSATTRLSIHRRFCGLLFCGARTGRRRGCRGRRWHLVPCVGAIFPVCAFLYADAHKRFSDVLASSVSCPGANLIKRLLV